MLSFILTFAVCGEWCVCEWVLCGSAAAYPNDSVNHLARPPTAATCLLPPSELAPPELMLPPDLVLGAIAAGSCCGGAQRGLAFDSSECHCWAVWTAGGASQRLWTSPDKQGKAEVPSATYLRY